MTKGDFLDWLGRHRRVDNIRMVVERGTWSEEALDRLKATLEAGGRLEMKNEFKQRRRMAWG